jgi:hypothetical protein
MGLSLLKKKKKKKENKTKEIKAKKKKKKISTNLGSVHRQCLERLRIFFRFTVTAPLKN